MSTQFQIQMKTMSLSSFIPVKTSLLQRKCACGQHSIAGGECVECRQKHEGMIQRAATSPASVSTVPPIVHDVLGSSGQPLDTGTRTFMEPRFGHDFSQVRVHTDARAAESARAVNALAYTIGRDVVFETGQYVPETAEGRRLLAHELTHVVQQSRDLMASTMIARQARVKESGGSYEQEAEQTAAEVIKLPPVVIQGIACSCGKETERDYDAKTFRFLTSIKPLINSIAGNKGVSPVAVAGAIADEYNTRRGWKGIVDSIQDAVIGSLPEFAISIDRFFDIHYKLLNTLENDVGPANIKVRTALELVQRGQLTVPGSPPSNESVKRIVDFLLTERGTVGATTAVIARGQSLFGPYLSEHGEELAEAVLVEYYKGGDPWFNRYLKKLLVNPNHKACPGSGGCRYWHNRDHIQAALFEQLGDFPIPPIASSIKAA